jgi:hypothetical protein
MLDITVAEVGGYAGTYSEKGGIAVSYSLRLVIMGCERKSF